MTPQMLVTDLDATLLGPPEFDDVVRDFLSNLETPWVVATGRSAESALGELAKRRIPPPAVLVCDVGTSIHRPEAAGFESDQAWQDEFSDFDRDGITAFMEPFGLEAQGHPRAHKLSYFSDREAATRIAREMPSAMAEVVFSHGKYLDILPVGGSKGGAVAWVARTAGVTTCEVVAVGDSGNDASMLHAVGMPAMVANADEDLVEACGSLEHVYCSPRAYGLGVIDAYHHFGGVSA